MVALLAAGAFFGAGAYWARPPAAPASAAVSLELGYEWKRAIAGVTAAGTLGGDLNTSWAAAKADFIVLDGDVAPLVGAGAGFLGQTFARPTATSVLELGARLFGHAIVSVERVGTFPRAATPIPVWLFGLRILG